MEQTIIPTDTGFADALLIRQLSSAPGTGASTGTALAQPFSRTIKLYSTRIAGTSHTSDIDILAAALEIGERLKLKLNPGGNFGDPDVVEILNSNGARIGFLPCDEEEIIINMLEAGLEVYAIVAGETHTAGWWNIRIEVTLCF
jgi:hypothetical protein